MAIINKSTVNELLISCTFNQEELKELYNGSDPCIIAYGVTKNYVFKPNKIEKYEPLIHEILLQLSERFQLSVNNQGIEYKEMIKDKNGDEWGSIEDAENLLCLGLASGWLEFTTPRIAWPMTPIHVVMYDERYPKDALPWILQPVSLW